MQTSHRIHFGLAQRMDAVADTTVDLVVTSPPYPMIDMWDEGMIRQNPAIGEALAQQDGSTAFVLMHAELDRVWQEVSRVTKPGAFVCINIGDATRSIGGQFQLFSNHSRIVSWFVANGFSCLPAILWRKPTNAPNKFMGSGMLPAGAYVTLEHEYILIFRKGGKRVFKSELEKRNRQQSAFFWEERNDWFSDLWDIRGTRQKMLNPLARERSGAYPLEIPYRLINMYSVKGDTVLDPFLGTGTTALAALAAGRNSVGYELDERLATPIYATLEATCLPLVNQLVQDRLTAHQAFVGKRLATGKEPLKYVNRPHQFPVMTSQEIELCLPTVDAIERTGNRINAVYAPVPVFSPAFTALPLLP